MDSTNGRYKASSDSPAECCGSSGRCARMTWSRENYCCSYDRPVAATAHFFLHSYRSASTGSSFAACIAGNQPLITPTKIRINVERNSVVVDKVR
jgi:hypothetical protein